MQFKLTATAVAIAAAFGASAVSAAPVVGAGASAIRNTAEGVVASYCAAAANLTKYTGTNTNVTRMFCTTTTGATGLGTNFDFTYDSNGGSWRYATSPFPSLTTAIDGTADGIQSVSTTGCTGTTTATIGLVAGVTVLTGCPLITSMANLGTSVGGTTPPVAIGFSDVEPDLFLNQSNRPHQGGIPSNPAIASFPTDTSSTKIASVTSFKGPVLGVVFGVAASKNLYSALQADQIASLPGCVAGANLADPVCAPSITRQRYRSIVQNASTAGGGALQFDDTYLFDGARAAGTAVNLARRDMGSGTQGGSNAFFLSIGCGNSLADLQAAPVAPGATETVTVNQATSGVVAQISVAGVSALGIVSRENSPTSTGAWGFLKLDGVYPLTANAITGKYDYFTEEFLYCRSGASAEEAKLCTDLQSSTTGNPAPATGLPLFNNTTGAFALVTLFTGYPTQPAAQGTYYRSLGNTCGKSFAQ